LGRRVVTGKKRALVEVGGEASGSKVAEAPVPRAGTAVVAEKRATAEMEEAILPIAEPAAKKEVERRSRVRAKVNFFACVRSEAFGEDVVMCIDMAKGGVSFKSGNCYEKEARITIAVPFAAEERGAPAIFVRGRIANVKKIGGGEMWRCGVEFLKQ